MSDFFLLKLPILPSWPESGGPADHRTQERGCVLGLLTGQAGACRIPETAGSGSLYRAGGLPQGGRPTEDAGPRPGPPDGRRAAAAVVRRRPARLFPIQPPRERSPGRRRAAGLRLLVALCREPQRVSGDKPFFLACRSAGKLLRVAYELCLCIGAYLRLAPGSVTHKRREISPCCSIGSTPAAEAARAASLGLRGRSAAADPFRIRGGVHYA